MISLRVTNDLVAPDGTVVCQVRSDDAMLLNHELLISKLGRIRIRYLQDQHVPEELSGLEAYAVLARYLASRCRFSWDITPVETGQ